jgi:hypothetical protein
LALEAAVAVDILRRQVVPEAAAAAAAVVARTAISYRQSSYRMSSMSM